MHHGLVAAGGNKDKVELIMAPTHPWATFGWGAILPKCISSNCKMCLSKLLKVCVKIVRYICPTLTLLTIGVTATFGLGAS